MRKIALYSVLSILVLCLCIGVTLAIVSPQSTPAIEASESTQSIAEIVDVDINGSSQRLLIRGHDAGNPILLHVHGGPGGADQAMLRAYNFDLEDQFTVVYWDQRGAGASYSDDAPLADLSLKQIAADGVSVTEYLLSRFGKEKLFLQGHSWGTLVSVHMISERPELFAAYFGIGHIANSKRAELLSYQFTMQSAVIVGDQETINKLEEIGSPPYTTPEDWTNTVMIERGLMQPYEMPDGSQFMSMADIYRIFTLYRGYSIGDKLNSLAGSQTSIEKLWLEAIDADLFNTHTEFEIPVFMFQGKYDQHTVTSVAREYFEQINAPEKQYFEFEHSAHWPHLREFEKYRELVLVQRDRLGP